MSVQLVHPGLTPSPSSTLRVGGGGLTHLSPHCWAQGTRMLSEYLSLQPWHLGSTSEGSQTEPRPTRAGQRCWVHLLGVPMPLLSLGGWPPASRFTRRPRVSCQGQGWRKQQPRHVLHPCPHVLKLPGHPVGPIRAPPLSLSLTQSWCTPRLLHKWGPSKWESMRF